MEIKSYTQGWIFKKERGGQKNSMSKDPSFFECARIEGYPVWKMNVKSDAGGWKWEDMERRINTAVVEYSCEHAKNHQIALALLIDFM